MGVENTFAKSGKSIKDALRYLSNIPDKEVVRARAKRLTSLESVAEMLVDYQHLLVSTDYLRIEAYAFFVERKTYKQIAEEYNIEQSYLRNIIYKESKRLHMDIGLDPFKLTVSGGFVGDTDKDGASLHATTVTIRTLIDMCGDRKPKLKIGRSAVVDEQLTVDISKVAVIDRLFNAGVTDDEFVELAELLKYISKPYLQMLLASIDAKHIGYIQYLLTTEDGSLTDIDKTRKRDLREIWMLNE